MAVGSRQRSHKATIDESATQNKELAKKALDHTLGVPQDVEPSRRRKINGRGRPRSTKSPSLDTTRSDHVHAEWDVGHGGISQNMEVEVREEASPGSRSGDSTALLVNNTPAYPVAEGPVVIVRVEEVLLVVLVLMIWVAAIALFFNRWGKIRMLEPYQPKFHQQPHRPSCPLAPLSPPGVPQVSNTLPRAQKPTTQRMSFSKYNVNAMTDPLSALPSPIIRRPRQNSVFVGSSTMAILNPPPRRVKSAIDIQHMVVNEHSPTSLTGSVIPILNRDRRPSITIERPRHRPSISIGDRPPPPPQRYRRSSCFVERPSRHHRNFISFDHPLNNDRKMSINIERPSCSYHQPIVSFEAHVEPSSVKVDVPPSKFPKISRSFEQPPKERSKPERMANSLEISSVSFDRRCSIPEEDRSSPVFIAMDESKITAPLLEGLKSSDV